MMMPDRYDELRKRLAVQQIKPVSMFDGQNLPITDYPDDEPEAIDSPVEEAREPAQAPDNTVDPRSAAMLADAVTAGAPGLLSLLGGGSPAVVSHLMDKGDKYINARGAQEEATKKNMSVIDRDGQPLNVMTRDALGEKPYYPARAGSAQSLAGQVSGIPKQMFNPKTGDRKLVQQYKDGTAFVYGTKDQIPDIAEWQPDLGVGSATGTDVYGTKTQDQYNKNKPKLANVKTTPGLGEFMGHIPKAEADARIADAKKAKGKIAESLSTIQELKAHRNTILSTKDPMTFSIAMGNVLRTVEKRLSEPEQKLFLGNDYRGILGNIENYAQGKMGIIPDSLRDGTVKAIDYIEARESGKLKANSSSYTGKEGLNKKGSDVINRTSGQPTVAPTNAWKDKLKGL